MAKKPVEVKEPQPVETNDNQPCKYHFVTSFSTRLWDKYANKAVGSFIHDYMKNGFPNGIESFSVVFDKNEEIDPFIEMLGVSDLNEETKERFRFAALDSLPQFIGFVRQFGDDIPLKDRGMDMSKIKEGARFRFNYFPFAKKVFAWAATYFTIPENEYMVWVDADIQLVQRFGNDFLDPIVQTGAELAFLDRDFPWYAAETGFFILKRTPAVDNFVQMILHAYISGFIFDMAEWHDGFVFKSLIKFTANVPIRIVNLNTTMRERDVFERTMLADVMIHYKGSTKQVLKDAGVGDEFDDSGTMVNFDIEDQDYKD